LYLGCGKKKLATWKKRTMNEQAHFLKYELRTELVHFKMCELNF